MSTYYGVNADKRDVDVPQSRINPGEVIGDLKVAYDEYTVSAALASDDVIKLMKLPAGARVVEVIFDHDDLGTSGTLKLGWEASSDGSTETADDNGFLASVDLNAAANTVLMSSEASVPGMLKKFDAEVQVSATLTAATTATTGTIKCAVLFVQT